MGFGVVAEVVYFGLILLLGALVLRDFDVFVVFGYFLHGGF